MLPMSHKYKNCIAAVPTAASVVPGIGATAISSFFVGLLVRGELAWVAVFVLLTALCRNAGL